MNVNDFVEMHGYFSFIYPLQGTDDGSSPVKINY